MNVRLAINNYIMCPKIGEVPSLLRRGLMRPSVSTPIAKSDVFSKTKLPVLNCAGSFCFSQALRDGIKNVDLHHVEIAIDKEGGRVDFKGYPQLTHGINRVLKDVPELFNIFLHKDAYREGLDRHVLSSYQQLLEHPEFKKLSPRKQNILEHAVLNHDTGKAFVRGAEHPERSAQIVENRYKKLAMPTKDRDLIVKLVRHHHYSGNIADNQQTYQYYAKIFREDEFKLLKILTDSDLKSKRGDVGHRFEENKEFFANQEALYKSMRPSTSTPMAQSLNLCA